MNCYETLEVSQSASPEVIKAAYKSLMQRYHPDKNPGNAEIAAHALQVVQAYEVLSDPDKRTAYDIKLRQQAADYANAIRDRSSGVRAASARNGSPVAEERKSYWLLWLLIALTIGFSLFAMSVLKSDKSPGSDLANPGISAREAVARASEEVARTIPSYVLDMSVELRDTNGSSLVDAARVLSIPVMGVTVGRTDSQTVVRTLETRKDLVLQKLEERLAGAKYDELIKADGEQYLKNLVVNSINDAIGTNQLDGVSLSGAGTQRPYGVADVALPRSYSVH
ncbi:MAG: DnaJ domain-containing protein [Nitrosomonadales bacterium]|nr:DnaJ domain-containing protein [Nitrosomonadales bacterium]